MSLIEIYYSFINFDTLIFLVLILLFQQHHLNLENHILIII